MEGFGLITNQHPLDDQKLWLSTPAYDSPISPAEHEVIQKEIDSIIGTTRGGKSICTLVWNGDVNVWKELYDDWDAYGWPIGGLKKRPWVCYRSVFNSRDEFVRDAFVPRFILLTRLEPEQYAETWKATAFFWCPERKRKVQLKPTTIPTDFYLWFRTIADHRLGCCQIAAREDRACYGYYVYPRQCLEELRQIRRGMDAAQMPENHPFDSPDVISVRIRERSTNNYAEQAIRKYRKRASFLLDEAPLVGVSNKLIEEGASRHKMRNELNEQLKYGQDALERELKQKGAI